MIIRLKPSHGDQVGAEGRLFEHGHHQIGQDEFMGGNDCRTTGQAAFVGGTFLNSGTLRVGNLTAFSNGTVTLAGGVLTNYTWTLFATGTTITGCDVAKFAINVDALNGTSGFSNTTNGSFELVLGDSNTDLILTSHFLPKPPQTLPWEFWFSLSLQALP